VYDAQVSRLVLESACREIERTKKYMQATSEVLDVLEQQRGVWEGRLAAINDVERRSKDTQQELLEAQQECEREALEAKQKAELEEANPRTAKRLKSLSLVAGLGWRPRDLRSNDRRPPAICMRRW
jgi:hypothetical protein